MASVKGRLSRLACARLAKAASSISTAALAAAALSQSMGEPGPRLRAKMSVSALTAVRPRFALERVFKDLVAGAVCGFLAIVLSISFASLLLPAELHNFLPAAIGIALFSTMVAAALAALVSPIPGAVSVVQEIPVVAIAGMASAIAAAMAGRANPETTFVTIVAASMLATIATGLVLLLLGFFRLGSLIRFVPFPVIGGFLAGTGWL